MPGTGLFISIPSICTKNQNPICQMFKKKVILNIRISFVKFRLSNTQFPDIDTAFIIIKKKNIKQFKFDQLFDK